jgi:hypothetical protein
VAEIASQIWEKRAIRLHCFSAALGGCGSEMKIISCICERAVIKNILTYMKRYAELISQRAPAAALSSGFSESVQGCPAMQVDRNMGSG